MTWHRRKKQGTLPPAIFLKVNNNSSSFRDFCFVIKTSAFKSTCLTRGHRPPQFKFNTLFNKHFALIIYFLSKVFYRTKTGEVDYDFKLVQ